MSRLMRIVVWPLFAVIAAVIWLIFIACCLGAIFGAIREAIS